MDHGQVELEVQGWLTRLFGPRPRVFIVREADIEGARQSLPGGANVLSVDPKGNYIIYGLPNGDLRIRFRASAAWLPNEPTLIENRTNQTKASLMVDGRVLVLEGLHRTRALARNREIIARNLGGAERAPGWLDFVFDPEEAMESESSLDLSGPWNPIPAK